MTLTSDTFEALLEADLMSTSASFSALANESSDLHCTAITSTSTLTSFEALVNCVSDALELLSDLLEVLLDVPMTLTSDTFEALLEADLMSTSASFSALANESSDLHCTAITSTSTLTSFEALVNCVSDALELLFIAKTKLGSTSTSSGALTEGSSNLLE